MSEFEKIGRFTVLERLGVGSFTVVYRGEDTFSKLPVAIKICIAQDENLRTGFLRLAETARRLRHPHIVSVLEFGSGEGKPYLIEEYIPGEHLGWRIEGDEPIPQARRIEYLRQIAEAMAYAHGQGVLHKHLGPRSIRVLDRTQVKVADFGIAQLANATARLADPATATRTDGYLAPEQALGMRADARTDIFCYGALAFELLTYEKPFAGDSLAEFLEQTLQGPAGGDRLEALPAIVAPVVRRCLRKDPADRFESFAELLNALGAVAGFVPDAAALDRSSPSLEETQQIPRSSVPARNENSPPLETPHPAAPSSWLLEPSPPETTLKQPGDDPGDVTLLPGDAALPAAAARLDATNFVPWIPKEELDPPAPRLPAEARPAAETSSSEVLPPPPSAAAAEPPRWAQRKPAERPGVEPKSEPKSELLAEPPRPEPPRTHPAPAPAPARPTKAAAAAPSHPRRRWWIAASLGLLLALLGLWALTGNRAEQEPTPAPVSEPAPAASPAAPVVRPGFLSVDARPWAEIVIRRPDGSTLELAEPFTPQLLDLEAGTYLVELRHPDVQEPSVCQVEIRSGETQQCRADFPVLTPTDYFKRAGWWR